MRLVTTCGLLFCLSTVPAICQSSSTPTPVAPAEVSKASGDYTALRENMSQQNKALQDQLAVQRAIVKQKQALLKDAQHLDAANKKLEAEKKKLQVEAGDLDKQREALKAAQRPVENTLVSTATVSN